MNDLEKWNVRGPVRTLRKEFAEWDAAKDGWKESKGYSLVEFRRDGQLGASEFHNPDGSIMRQSFLYDEIGRLEEMHARMNDGPFSRTLYSFDDLGRPSRTTNVDPNGVRTDSEICSYDSAGRKTKVGFLPQAASARTVMYHIDDSEEAYGAPGAASLTTSFDEQGRATETVVHDSAHRLLQQIVMTRDASGSLLKTEVLAAGQSPFSELEKKLPAAEREQILATLKEMFAPGKVTISITYSYDPKGRRIERYTQMFDMEAERHRYGFDAQDNPVEELIETHNRDTGVAKQVNRFDYQYDAYGNWTERIVSGVIENTGDVRHSNIERRVITYH